MHLIKDHCTGCGYCVLVCPYDALKSDGWAEVIPANCTECNLCVYACPSDCFVPEPEFPLKPYRPRVKTAYDVVIIGSGIGGLMAGVALAQAGHSVAVFEKLGFPGGRYTELDYKGAAVTTGAWTNLGPKSHIGRFLADLGLDLAYTSIADMGLPEQYTLRFPDGRHYAGLFDLLTPTARKAWLKAILKGREKLNERMANGEMNQRMANGEMNERMANGEMNQRIANGEMNQRIANGEMNERMANGEMNERMANGEMNERIANGEMNQRIANGEMNQRIANGEMNERIANGEMNQRMANGEMNERMAHSLDTLSTAAYIAQFSSDPDLLAAVDAIAATASGLNSRLIPASEYIQITLAGREAGQDFAMPVGGVRAIIKALTKALRQAGGDLFVRTPVSEILVEPPAAASSSHLSASPPPRLPISSSPRLTASGITLADGRQIRSQVVLHNGGPGRFVNLVGADNLPPDYVARLTSLKSVECAALFGATREPLFADAPIMMTPCCRRVVGIFAPTLLDPKLSKNGLHLFDAFFPTYSNDRTAELELALADLRDLFPNFDKVIEWTVPMFFTGTWPGAESSQTFGQTGDQRLDPATPIQNCYLVGMDAQGSGVAGDLIPLGVRRVLEYLGVHR